MTFPPYSLEIKRLVYSKLLGRTFPDYFKMSTEEQHRELSDREEDWLGSSGAQVFFVRASDNILASWEEVCGPKLGSR